MGTVEQLAVRASNEPGLSEALVWLAEFKQIVANNDAATVLHHLVQLGVKHPDRCRCVQEAMSDIPVVAWLHSNHAEYNRAVWEIVTQQPGMIDRLRSAIRADISGPSKRIDGQIYGEITARSYARALLASFIKHKPSTQWIGA